MPDLRRLPPFQTLAILITSVLAVGCASARTVPTPPSADGPASITLAVMPSIVMAGGTIRLTCRIPRRDTNRRLIYGVEDVTRSDRELEGDRAAVTFRAYIDHMPCDAHQAFCILVDASDREERARQSFMVTGCDSPGGVR